ncbi:MAG TPA: TonB-dependent receptor [Candidatus Marinimicrobia bacterium]|nr:TonB-dependent receptor [Candidatus Neomarinimicrobiota bacterium]
MKQFFYILLLVSLGLSQSRDVKGSTIDATNGNPIPGVNVIIEGSTTGAASQIDGSFSFSTTQEFPITLIATHIAYDQAKVIVDRDTLIQIELSQTVIKGQEVDVIGARRKVELDVASAVDRIDIEAIELQGARDFGSALRRVSSLQLNYANSGKQTVSIRGSNATDVAVFLDGVRINDANTGVADLSFIDLNSIEQIQVVKGGGSSLFGSDAIGGVVNVETRKATSNTVYVAEGLGQTYGDDLDLSYGATGVYGPAGIGGRYTGKKRAYGRRTITTSIFNNAFAGVDLVSGRFDLTWYNLGKSLEFESKSVTADDGLEVISGKYTGSVLGTKDWTFIVGQRSWKLDQNYFTSVKEALQDGSIMLQTSKGFNIRDIKNVIQLESETQYFNGDRSYFDVDGLSTEDHIAEMNRNTTAGALVSRWAITSDSPIVDHINWEFGFRFNNIKTNMDETYDYYSNGLPTTEPVLINNQFSSIVTSKRLGVHVDGQTNKLRYSLFVNQGSNSRLPTLSDRFHFAHAVFDSSMDTVLTREHLAATEVNMDMTFMDVQAELPISEINLILGVFINDYTNKIAYRPMEEGPAVPFNDLTADIRGFEAAMRMRFLDGKLLLGTSGTWMSISNIMAFPNKPEYRLVSTAELNLDWLTMSFDHINEGEQYYYVPGFGEGVRKPRENANLNITLQKRLWKINCSLSYTIRNIKSKEELDLTLEESIRHGFNYFERYREIITLKVSI